MKRYVRIFAVVLGLVALGAAGLAFVYVRPLAVEVARWEEDVPVQVYGLGTVEARIVSDMAFEVDNTLVELHADHGDRVAKGDVLARLHQEEQEARVAKAAAERSRTAADLEMAQARVEQAAAVLAQKQQANRRRQGLVGRGGVSEEEAEAAQTEEAVAGAELVVARSDVAVAEAELANAQAQLRLEQVMLEHYTLTAPYDAIVVERHKELGTVLAPGERVFTLADPDTVWVLAYVDEARAGGLRVGQPAQIQLRSLPSRTFRGHVARIGIESDRVSEERRVYIAFDRIPDDFHLHEQAEALITTARLERSLLVPQTAVEKFDGTSGMVWTVEDGRLARHEARFGRRTLDGRLELVDGLREDAEVVVDLPFGLREGRRATVASEAAS
jgi:HlyD family secretion protein